MPLTARYDWVDVIIGFDTFRRGRRLMRWRSAEQDGILKKLVTVVAGARAA